MINEIKTVIKEDDNMSNLKWWTGDIEVVEIEGRFIALDGWNGEEYTDCWEVEEIIKDTAYGVKVDGLKVKPIYEEIEQDNFELTGYEFV